MSNPVEALIASVMRRLRDCAPNVDYLARHLKADKNALELIQGSADLMRESSEQLKSALASLRGAAEPDTPLATILREMDIDHVALRAQVARLEQEIRAGQFIQSIKDMMQEGVEKMLVENMLALVADELAAIGKAMAP